MINAKEIRIGNLVEYRITDKLDERKEWWEVSEIDADDIHWLSKVDTKDEDFRAIPITEELLEKLGFKQNKFDKVFEVENCQIEIYFFDNDIKCTVCVDSVINKNIKHVHQLQNVMQQLTHFLLKRSINFAIDERVLYFY